MKTYGTKRLLPVYGNSRPVERRINNQKIAGWKEQNISATPIIAQEDTYNDSAFLRIYGNSEQVGIPSPESPVNINSVENFDLITEGKNLFNKNDTTRIINGYNNVSIISSISHRMVFIPCKPNTDYTISKMLTSRFSVFTTTVLPASGVTTTTLTNNNSATQITVKTGETANYLCVYLYNSNTDGAISLEELFNSIQIEIGIFKTFYQPYQNKTINFPYTLYSMPDGTKDYIEIDNINKTAKLYRNVGEKVFDGTESWGTQVINGNNNFYSDPINTAIGTQLIYCNHQRSIVTAPTYAENCYISSTKRFNIQTALITFTAVAFKTWVAEQYANGTPVTVHYKLETPTIENLDYAEVITYYPYTQIYTNATIQPTLDVKIRIIDK